MLHILKLLQLFKIDDEYFIAKGQRMNEQNFLEIYNIHSFSDSILPKFTKGETLKISNLKMDESSTKPPPLLSESSLIGLMDKNGIGTDATIHEHINKIQERDYAVKKLNRFQPTPIGLHLIEVYSKMGIHLGKPDLRAEMERDMKLIAEGQKTKDDVLKIHLNSMKEILNKVKDSKDQMYNYLKQHLRSDAVVLRHEMIKNSEFAVCPTCKYNKLVFRLSKLDKLFIACNGFPKCKTTFSVPDGIQYIEKLTQECTKCSDKKKGYVNLFKLQFTQPYIEDNEISQILKGKDHGDFCVNKDCDPNITALIKSTRRINFLQSKGKDKVNPK